MKRVWFIMLNFSFLVLAVYLRCTESTMAGGGTIETTNGIVGTIYMYDSLRSVNTVVKLFPDAYDPVTDGMPDKNSVDTTDSDGNYQFRDIEPGKYVILARNQNTKLSSITRNILVSNDSVTVAPEGILNKSGTIATEFSSGSASSGDYIYIPGTDLFSMVNTDGSALLNGVPAGLIKDVILVTKENKKYNLLSAEIDVIAGETRKISQPLWKYNKRITLNTSASGADISGNVFNFPVLIRLHSGNFNFSEAQPDGQDMMFTGSDSEELAFEIEKWDITAKSAEIWVKVDTITGNNSNQFIVMYWGNPVATQVSNSTTVFDTTTGFQGVWHLGEINSAIVKDATSNNYYGTATDTANPTVADGIVGKCRVFDGKTDFIRMPNTADSKLNFPNDAYYTVSAWVHLDTMDNTTHLIIAKGYEQYFLRLNYFPTDSPLWEFVEFSKDDTWQACTTSATNLYWTLLTGVRMGQRQFLYCNGVLVDSTISTYQKTNYSRNTSYDVTIGKFIDAISLPNNTTGHCFFKGAIDEVRIMSISQSSDWIRLCYMNQRLDDRLVVFK